MSEPTGHDEPQADPAANSGGGSDGSSHGEPPRGAPTGDAEHARAHDPTGDAEIDAALATLADLDSVPVHDHATVVERVHRVLQDRLADGQE